MSDSTYKTRIIKFKTSLNRLCTDSGILDGTDFEQVYYEDLIASGIVDSMGIVHLQDQIETEFNITITLEQFVAELHTLDKLVNYLARSNTARVSA